MRLFGTDGIRGKANEYPLTPEFILNIGKAAASFFSSESDSIIVGGDTRQSTSMISSALVSAINSKGINTIVADIIPTPILAWLTKKFSARCGIMVSASHNPWYDNGIKFFKPDATKLSLAEEAGFENLIFSQKPNEQGPVGYMYQFVDWQEPYLEHIDSLFDLDLSKRKIIVDCANGATSFIAPRIFKRFGGQPELLNVASDGCNINEDCGTEHTAALASEVLLKSADLGIAFDGDGDRLMLIDEKGALIDGDSLMGIFAVYLKQKGRLNNNAIVLTRYSNLGLVKALEERGISVVFAQPGDRFVAEQMRQKGLVLAGEASGHIILGELETTGNGFLCALMILQIMQESSKTLSELNFVEKYPQLIKNVEVSSKPRLETLPKVMEAIKSAESSLGDAGRVFVRYSGTQPLARVMVEAQNKEQAEQYSDLIAKALKAEIQR